MGIMDTIETFLDFLDLLDLLFSPLISLFKRDSRSPLENIPLPQADLTDRTSGRQVYTDQPEDIWKDLGVRK